MEENWARQKQRTLLRPQNGRNGIGGTGGLPERHHHSAWLQTIERTQDKDFRNNMNFVIRAKKFHCFIILTTIVPVSHDYVTAFRNAILRLKSENETKSD
jgi:carbamate kinase